MSSIKTIIDQQKLIRIQVYFLKIGLHVACFLALEHSLKIAMSFYFKQLSFIFSKYPVFYYGNATLYDFNSVCDTMWFYQTNQLVYIHDIHVHIPL